MLKYSYTDLDFINELLGKIENLTFSIENIYIINQLIINYYLKK
jgi:hypothetical protein